MTILTSALQTAAPRRLRLGVVLFMLGLLLAPWLAGAPAATIGCG